MCGLFGFIGKDKVAFNKFLFCELGIDNDSRGGDSCGIFIDGKSEYGIDDKKKFKDFYIESELIESSNKVKIAIGHDRKTSVGVTSLENAQPVIITNDNNEVDFVLIHNGTISNYKELCDKYLENAEGYTDSQVMAYIMYFWGYDVLSEYIGTGAFLTVDYRQNKKRNPIVHFFKGKSKKYSSYLNPEEERPLYLIKDRNGYWFSSLKEHLDIYCNINKSDTKHIDIECNTLYMIENYELYKVCEYDRTSLSQTVFTAASKKVGHDNVADELPLVVNPSYPYNDDYYPYNDVYYDWNDYYQDYYITPKIADTGNNVDDELKKINSLDYNSSVDVPIDIPKEFNKKCTWELVRELMKSHEHIRNTNAYLYFDGLCYMDGDSPADGIYNLTQSGFKLSGKSDTLIKNYYAFADGELLYHPKVLAALDILCMYYDCYPLDILDTLGGKSNYYTAMPYYSNDLAKYLSATNKIIKKSNFIMPLQNPSSYIISSIKDGVMTTYDIKKVYSEDYAKDFFNKSFLKYNYNYKMYDKLDLQTIMKIMYERFIS